MMPRDKYIAFLSGCNNEQFEQAIQNEPDYQALAALYHLLRDKKLRNPSQLLWLFQTYKMDLSKKNITDIPPLVFSFTQLQELYLDKNKIEEIPADIGFLTNLAVLSLEQNNIRSVPPEIGKLTQLKKLQLDWAKVQQLPAQIANCTNLRTLYLSNAQLKKLPDGFVHLMPNLQKLYLLQNNLQQFPSEILQGKQLQYLDLSKNEIAVLPDEIGTLQSLEHLLIGNNPIQMLPQNISQLSNLTELTLYQTLLTAADIEQLELLLPNCYVKHSQQQEQIIDMIASEDKDFRQLAFTLQETQGIDLSDFWEDLRKVARATGVGNKKNNRRELTNLLQSNNCTLKKALPKEIVRLEHLQYLKVEGVGLTPADIPQTLVQLRHLSHLGFVFCGLNALPDWFIGFSSQLQELFLSNNTFSEIPECLLHFSNLKTLGFAQNQISQLPDNIDLLANLTHFYLTRNRIEKLPDALCRLSQLEVLGLEGNRLADLPEEIGLLHQLVQLTLAENWFTSLPLSVCRLPQLKYLLLGDNQLNSLPAEMKHLSALEDLHLSRNKFAVFPKEVLTIPSLLHLDLCHNSELTELPEDICKLERLEFLDISNTNIKALPPSIERMKALRTLRFIATPITYEDTAYLRDKLPDCEFVIQKWNHWW